MRRILSLFMLMLLCVGVGWAATESFNFVNGADISDWSSWTSSYASHTVKGTVSTVTFEKANKQDANQTISDRPVTKGNAVSVVLNNTSDYNITGVKFVCKQWGSKAQTITLSTSSNGKDFTTTSTKSSNFELSASDLETKGVKFTFSSTSNQVGISSVEITYESLNDDLIDAPIVTINGEEPKASYDYAEGMELKIAFASSDGKANPYFDFTFNGHQSYIIQQTQTFTLDSEYTWKKLQAGENTLVVQELVNNGTAEQSNWQTCSKSKTITFIIDKPITTIAELNAKASNNESFTYQGGAVVLGQKGNNLFVTDIDNSAGTLIYGSTGQTYSFGDLIPSGWGGTITTYSGAPEVTSPTGFTAASGTADVTPLEATPADVTLANFGRYAVIKNATVTSDKITVDGASVTAYTSTLGVTAPSDADGKTYNVYGIIGYHNAVQFLPIKYEEVEDEPGEETCATPVINPNGGTFTESIEVTITAEDGASINYSTDGGQTWNNYEEALTFTETTTLQAQAVQDGKKNSEIVTATFTKQEATEDEPENITADEVITFSSDNFPTGEGIDVKWSAAAGTENTTAPTYNTNSSQARIYASGTLTVTALNGNKLKKIQFKGGVNSNNKGTVTPSWENATASTGTIKAADSTSKVWTAADEATESVTFTFDETVSAGNTYITVMGVDYYVSDVPTCAAPEIEVNAEYTEGDAVKPVITNNEEGATVFYTITDAEGAVKVSSESSESSIEIDNAPAEIGTYTISAYATLDGKNDSKTVTATYTVKAAPQPVTGTQYTLVESASDLEDGAEYVIAATGYDVVLGLSSGAGIKDDFEFSTDRKTITISDDNTTIARLVINESDTEGSYNVMNGEKYMKLGSGANPTYVTDANAIPIAIANGVATLTGETTNTTVRQLLYRGDGNNNVFKNYASSNATVSGYSTIALYKKVEAEQGLSLEEVLALEEETEVTIADELVVVEQFNGYSFATDGNGNWIRIDNLNADKTEVVKNIKGSYNGNYLKPTITATAQTSTGKTDDTNYITEINLTVGFEMPQPAQVVNVIGYYDAYEENLRGLPAGGNGRGQSLTLDGAFAEKEISDMGFQDSYKYQVPVAIEYKEAMSDDMKAPRRASEYKFQNLTGQLLVSEAPNPIAVPTAIETIEAGAEVKSVRYIDLAGRELAAPAQGVNIVITTLQDGTVKTTKVVY